MEVMIPTWNALINGSNDSDMECAINGSNDSDMERANQWETIIRAGEMQDR